MGQRVTAIGRHERPTYAGRGNGQPKKIRASAIPRGGCRRGKEWRGKAAPTRGVRPSASCGPDRANRGEGPMSATSGAKVFDSSVQRSPS